MKGSKLIQKLYYNKFISSVFHTSIYCIKKEVQNCESVLDLGCGPESPIKYFPVFFSVGVDVFRPYIKNSKENSIHSEYILSDIKKMNFKPKSFDSILLIEVLEHLPKKHGRELLRKIEKWARKKVIISCPNGFLPQKVIDGNIFQRHLSGWEMGEMKKMGYKPYGMAGWKFLRKEHDGDENRGSHSIFSTIRFRPKILWLIFSGLTQLVTYYFPKLAFEIFYVKELDVK